jgi:hypothetical protein
MPQGIDGVKAALHPPFDDDNRLFKEFKPDIKLHGSDCVASDGIGHSQVAY